MIDYISTISTVGFPIVAFCMMYKFATDALTRNTSALTELSIVIAKLKK